MIDWNDLQYVLALRDGGTMKQAAALLKTDPTTVSRHIKTLSQRFDQNIFELEKSGQWKLTPTGDELVLLAEMFKNRLDSLQSTESELAPDQTITVTSLEFLLAHYIASSMNRPISGYPNVGLRLIGSDRRLSLAYGEADIALRFGRPVEGQLLASKIASIEFSVYAYPGKSPTEWIAMHEDLDVLPEMKLGFSIFGVPPSIRVTSYAAAREAAKATGLAAIGPCVVLQQGGFLTRVSDIAPVYRGVWSVIHETRRFSKQLKVTRDWLKESILTAQEKYRLAEVASQAVPDLRQRPCG